MKMFKLGKIILLVEIVTVLATKFSYFTSFRS